MLKECIESHKRFAELWTRISIDNILTSPTEQELNTAKKIVRNMGGNLGHGYLIRVLVAYNFAIMHRHKISKISLCEDICAGRRIFLNSYTFESEKQQNVKIEGEDEYETSET